MTIATRHQIDAAVLENDLDELGNLLIDCEEDDDARCVLYEAIDRVASHLKVLVTIDDLCTLA